MIEILTVLDTREDYNKYKTLVTKNTTDYDIKRIIENIGIFYTDNPCNELSWSDFKVWFFVKNPMVTGLKKTLYEGMFDTVASVSGTLKSALLTTFIERYHAERIAFLAMEVAEGKKQNLEDVQKEFDEFLKVSGVLEGVEAVENMDLEDLLEQMNHGDGLDWRLAALNESLGKLRKGNFVCFAARPESGKTAMMCSEATYMATQLQEGKKVLYFTNEEGEQAIKLRLHMSLLGVNTAQLRANPAGCKADWTAALKGDINKIIVIEKADLTVNDIEGILKKKDVGLICIDQLRKVRGFDDMGGVQRMERLFQTAREWSKTYAPVITVTQLGDTTANPQYPDMNMLYESKTAIQGECDVIVNIGAVSGSIPEYARWLNIVKNKLPTPDVPALRHGRHEVLLLPEIARFK